MIEQLLSHALSIQRQAARQTLHVSCKDYRCSPDTSARSSKYRVTFSIFLYSPLWAVSLLHSIRVHLRSRITPSIAWTAVVLTRTNRFSDHSKPQCCLLLFFFQFLNHQYKVCTSCTALMKPKSPSRSRISLFLHWTIHLFNRRDIWSRSHRGVIHSWPCE